MDLLGQARTLGLLGLDDAHLQVRGQAGVGDLGEQAGVAALEEEPGVLHASHRQLELGQLLLVLAQIARQALDLDPQGLLAGVLGAGLGGGRRGDRPPCAARADRRPLGLLELDRGDGASEPGCRGRPRGSARSPSAGCWPRSPASTSLRRTARRSASRAILRRREQRPYRLEYTGRLSWADDPEDANDGPGRAFGRRFAPGPSVSWTSGKHLAAVPPRSSTSGQLPLRSSPRTIEQRARRSGRPGPGRPPATPPAGRAPGRGPSRPARSGCR